MGFVPMPVGVVGPLSLDGKAYYVPMATTEGALLASTNRGCAAIRRAGGATSALMAEGMTRAPLVRVDSLAEAAALRAWVEAPANAAALAAAFDSTTRFGRLKSISVATVSGRLRLQSPPSHRPRAAPRRAAPRHRVLRARPTLRRRPAATCTCASRR
jgi:hydroxymethylglutaryl-CoA reductase (NADPH)